MTNEDALRIARNCDALGNDRVTGALLEEAANTIRALVLRTPEGRTEMQVRLQNLAKAWRRSRLIALREGDKTSNRLQWDRAEVFDRCIDDLRRVADLRPEPLPVASPDFVVVPEEPTEAMVRAGLLSMVRTTTIYWLKALWPRAGRDPAGGIRHLWRSMLDARPREDGPVAPEAREY